MDDVVIPRRFHWIWLGERPLPATFAEWMDGWLERHPGWEHTLWTERNRPRLRNERQFQAAVNWAQKADVLRYELLLDHGGVYLDCDVECGRSIEPLISGVHAFAGRESPDLVSIGVVGAVAGHPWLAELVARLPEAFASEISQVDQTGPGLVTDVTAGRSDVAVFPPEVFYPYGWPAREPRPRPADYPNAYALHHWDASWLPERAERMLALAEIDALIPGGAPLFLVTATLGPLDVPGREVIHLYPRYERDSDFPASCDEAIREFERVRTPAVRWLVIHRWAYWWFKAYPGFFAHLESIGTQVRRGRWVAAYHLRG